MIYNNVTCTTCIIQTAKEKNESREKSTEWKKRDLKALKPCVIKRIQYQTREKLLELNYYWQIVYFYQ